MLGGGGGKNYWWIAPVADQANIAFTRLLRFLDRATYTANRTLRTVVLVNGSIIWFKGADRPDSLYGDDVYAAVIDEASRFKADAWHAVRSTLTYTRGPIRLIGNVRGRHNWFYELSRRAQLGEPNMAYHKIVAYDAVAAGVLDDAEIEQAKHTIPEHVFRELYLAEASDDGGNPFGLLAIAGCVAPYSAKPAKVWGWDLAKHVDWTVGVALDEDRVVCRFERFRLPWEETLDRIRKATKTTPALVDSTGVGDPILERLQRNPPALNYEGYHFHPTSKQKLMEGLAVAIQSRVVRFPDNEIKIELELFEYILARTGIRYGAREGYNDDCVCALALAVEHAAHAPTRLRVPAKALMRAAFGAPSSRFSGGRSLRGI